MPDVSDASRCAHWYHPSGEISRGAQVVTAFKNCPLSSQAERELRGTTRGPPIRDVILEKGSGAARAEREFNFCLVELTRTPQNSRSVPCLTFAKATKWVCNNIFYNVDFAPDVCVGFILKVGYLQLTTKF